MKCLTELVVADFPIIRALREKVISPTHFANLEKETVSEYGLSVTIHNLLPSETPTDLLVVNDVVLTTADPLKTIPGLHVFYSMREVDIWTLYLLFSKESKFFELFKDYSQDDFAALWTRYGGYFLECDVVFDVQNDGRSLVRVAPNSALKDCELPTEIFGKMESMYQDIFGVVNIDTRLLDKLKAAGKNLEFWAKHGNGALSKAVTK